MLFSYDFLQSFFKEKLPSPEDLSRLLIMRFFEVEGVIKEGKDFSLDIDILPSRATDCLSHIGVVREISAMTGKKYILPKIKVKESGKDISEYVEVEVRNACDRYTLRVIDNVKVGESPRFIKDRLKTCGLKPINSVVDIANYVMLETGQPLHTFDGDKVEGGKIIVRYAKKREKIVTLDEKRYELDSDILVISDQLSPIGIAGIKGGIVPEIDEETTVVFLESANFNRRVIRNGSKKLGMRTDASIRFEYGLSPFIAKEALDRAASMIAEICGGDVAKGVIDVPNPEENNSLLSKEEKKIIFETEDIRGVLGVEVPLAEIERILRSLGLRVSRKENKFEVHIPHFRMDLSIKEDLIEEVGRVYGYENIEPSVPTEKILPPEENRSLTVERRLKEEMRALTFVESYNYSFLDEKIAGIFGYDNLQEMDKPVSLDYKYLRPSLVPGVIKNVSENEKNFDSASIFEVGKTFFQLKEQKMICGSSFPSDFLKLKGKVDLLMKRLFVEELSYVSFSEHNFLNPHRSAQILSGKDVVGIIGELSRKAMSEMGIKSTVAVFELNVDKVAEMSKEMEAYEPISKFPPVLRDLSLIVPNKIKYEEVICKIKKEAGPLLEGVDLFDIYEGEGVPKNKRSLAFRLLFRAKNKTLSSEEINKIQDKVIKALDGIPSFKVRK